ncbi:hypothetical protein Tco_0648759 [Tanacetum coccineum]
MVTVMESSTRRPPNPSRLSETWQFLKHPKNSLIPSKPDHAHICIIRCSSRDLRAGQLRAHLTNEDYDEEREMESRPESTREVTLPLRMKFRTGKEAEPEVIPWVTDLQMLE